MVHSRRAREGYLLIDNRASGGIMTEVAVITCGHCHQQLIVNPLRIRVRGHCLKCDHYLCDRCENNKKISGGECANLNDTIDKIRDSIIHNVIEV